MGRRGVSEKFVSWPDSQAHEKWARLLSGNFVRYVAVSKLLHFIDVTALQWLNVPLKLLCLSHNKSSAP